MAKLNPTEQAVRIMNKMNLVGWTKQQQLSADAIGYRSIVTLAQREGDLRRATTRIFERENITKINQITGEMAQREVDFLVDKGLSSSTILGYSRVLSDMHHLLHSSPLNFDNLPSRGSDRPSESRAYTNAQINEIMKHQTVEYALMTELAKSAGLRVSEVTNIRPADEYPAQIAASRVSQLVEYRWAGRKGVEYSVTGKNGLERTVVISNDLSLRLEPFRLNKPREMLAMRGDDNRVFRQYYDLPSGEKWSRNFSYVSRKLFGWSRAAHGLRHTFAQTRMEELAGLKGLQFEQKLTRGQRLLAVSQTLGHFDAQQTNTYLR